MSEQKDVSKDTNNKSSAGAAHKDSEISAAIVDVSKEKDVKASPKLNYGFISAGVLGIVVIVIAIIIISTKNVNNLRTAELMAPNAQASLSSSSSDSSSLDSSSSDEVVAEDSEDAAAAAVPVVEEIVIPPAKIELKEKIAEFITNSNALENSQAAEGKALKWMIYDDPMELSSESDNLLQRYLMAYFYYHTTVNGPWYSCNPPVEGEDKNCTLTDFGFGKQKDFPASRWLSSDFECDWAGVSCDEFGKVTKLELWGYNLSGTFPVEIVKLPQLRWLRLGDNQMNGNLPAELGEIDNLERLLLPNNNFTGTIPHQWFSSLGEDPSLKRLDLSENSLSGTIATEFGQLNKLSFLYLHNNKMIGELPVEIFNTRKMRGFRVQGNRLTGTIPTEIGLWSKNMQKLILSRNDFIGTIPTELGKLKQMKDFYLEETKVSGPLPDGIYDWEKAWLLALEKNQLDGTISTKIGQLQNLEILWLAHNKFDGTVPTEVGNLSKLWNVTLHDNEFNGEIPQEMCTHVDKPFGLKGLIADCSPTENGEAPKIQCECCSMCCNSETGLCSAAP